MALAACGDDSAPPSVASNNNTTGTNNGTTGTNNGTSGTSGTTGTNTTGTTGTNSGTTGTTGTTGTNNNTTPTAQEVCEAQCADLVERCSEAFGEVCPPEVVGGLGDACIAACETPEGQGQIGAASQLACETVVPLAIEGFGLADICVPPTEDEICDNGADDDGDGDADCDDDDCADFAACIPDELCDNGTDDDGDGDTDCADDDCADALECQPEPEVCDDGLDNDGDGDTDCDDADCDDAANCQPQAEICNDGVDNDEDGDTDCDDDDCAAAPNCQPGAEICDNGQDDDGDGDADCDDADCADFAACIPDEICNDGLDNDRDGDADCDDDDCAAAPNCQPGAEICDNGQDDDGDGDADCDDADCDDFAACQPPADACAAPLPLAGPGRYEGDTTDGGDLYAGACINGTGGREVAYAWTAQSDGTFCFDTFGSGFDTALYVRADDCAAGAEAACDDDANNTVQSEVELTATAGTTYFVFVDGYDGDESGAYVLNVRAEPCATPTPEVCDDRIDNDDDGDADCADDDCADALNCQPEICDNGQDDNGDGDIDCADSDCIDAPSCQEVCDDGLDNDADGDADCDDADCDDFLACQPEDCANGQDDNGDGDTDCDDAACAADPLCVTGEVCDNSQDDDNDGAIDCADPECFGVGECPSEGDLRLVGGDEVSGRVEVFIQGQWGTVCDDLFGIEEADVICNQLGFNGALEARGNAAFGQGQEPTWLDNLACVGDEASLLDCDGNPVGVEDCSHSEDAGVVCALPGQCRNDDQCDGGAGEICFEGACTVPEPEDCADGIDNDLDGLTDCEDTEQCGSSPNCQEICDSGEDEDLDGDIDCDDTDCADAPNCSGEVCDNGADDDNDGNTDCDDTECADLPICFEPLSCQDPGELMGPGAYTGDTSGASNNHNGSCRATGGGVEQVWAWMAPADLTVCADTFGSSFDTVLYVRTDCGEPASQVACNDDAPGQNLRSSVEFDAVAGETYFFFVDGFNADASGAYTLNIEDCTPQPEVCDDGIDNDRDGDTDCEDIEQCGDFPACQEVCDDGLDNDADGLTDCADTDDCAGAPGCQEICDDGLDNDFDGLTDCADIDDCAGAPGCQEICNDGLDNDFDGLTDCADTDDCADALSCQPDAEICDDGIDNDDDGFTDCDDADCDAFVTCRDTCDLPEVIDGPGTYTGNTVNNGEFHAPTTCATFGSSSRESAFAWTAPADLTICADTLGTGFDTVLYVREADCAAGAEVTCNDDGGLGISPRSAVEFEAVAGETYFFFVDGYDNAGGPGPGGIDAGPFTLTIEDCTPQPEVCDDGIDNDGDGDTDCEDFEQCGDFPACQEVCDDGIDNDFNGLTDCEDLLACGAAPNCQPEDCADGIDNNGNGLTDCEDLLFCGADPVCQPEVCDDGIDNNGDGLTDCQDPDCAFDPACIPEICDDGVDNDNDGDTDCADDECAGLPECIEPFSCEQPGELTGPGVYGDDTTGASNNHSGSCRTSGGGVEHVWAWTAPADVTICADTFGSSFDTVLYVRTDCGEPASQVACNDDTPNQNFRSSVEFDAIAGETYFFFVDGYDSGELGAYALNIEDCTPAPEVCDNGADDDGDGDTDCFDDDCADFPACAPQPEDCADGLDNDFNGLTDCADPACFGVGACPNEGDLRLVGGDEASGRVEVFIQGQWGTVCDDAFDLREADVICNQLGFNGALEALGNAAFGQGQEPTWLDDLACVGDEASLLDCDGNAIGVEDCSHSEDAGVVCALPGQCRSDDQCDGDDICDEGVCTPPTPEICDDGIDNDFNGLTDCEDLLACGAALNCQPEDCADSVDNNGDGLIDCADPDCAFDPLCNTAQFTCASPAVLPAPGSYAGSTVGLDDNHDGECAFSGPGPEAVYSLTPLAGGTVCLDTYGSSVNTILYVREADCDLGDEACSDDIGLEGGVLSQLQLDLTAGTEYFIFVDGNAPGDIVLNYALGPCENTCVDGQDNDDDGDVDCLDANCTFFPACQPEANCTDGNDNDFDGLIDCEDPDCSANVACDTSFTCADPEPLTVPGQATGNNAGLGNSETLTGCASGLGGREAVYTFTAAADGAVCFDTGGSTYDTTLHVRAATCDDAGAQIGCNDDGVQDFGSRSNLQVNVVAGQTYFVFVDGYSSASVGDYVLNANLGPCANFCADGVDNDLDGNVDCADSECNGDPACRPEANCTDGVDNDFDGDIDCDDADCAGNAACLTPEVCDNGQDDDGDGAIDCADADCDAAPNCGPEPFTCDDPGAIAALGTFTDDTSGAPSDHRGSCRNSDQPEHVWAWTAPNDMIVCADTDGSSFDTILYVREADCAAGDEVICNDDAPGAPAGYRQSAVEFEAVAGETYFFFIDGWGAGDSGPYTFTIEDCTPDPEICDDGIDNDQDGLIDCADLEQCAAFPACQEVCDDGLDNDADGTTDCDDADCDAALNCQPEICNDGLDNNGDGLIDCEDFEQCAGAPNCNPEFDCANGIDDDEDGLIDCADDDCSFNPLCQEFECNDGLDNDGDGLIDCADIDDCAFDPVCIQEDCTNGFDDDLNGFTDCEDAACARDFACIPALEIPGLELGDTALEANLDAGSCGGDAAPESVFLMIPDQDGVVCLHTSESSFDTVLYVRQGAVDGPEVDCNDDGPDGTEISSRSQLELNLTGGEGYYVFIDGFDTESGEFAIFAEPGPCADICDDGLDNDADGTTDCDDVSCADAAVCIPDEVCNNGIDDDRDGLIDCEDFEQCAGAPNCNPEFDCANGIDDDEDGLLDCADPDCGFNPLCQEFQCDDGIDNDGDGLIDCADELDCGFDPVCVQEDCSNGFDDDLNGFTDCEDAACATDPVCARAPEVGELVITEIMYDTSDPLAEANAEWFEVFNTTDTSLNLDGCTVEDGTGSSPVVGLVIPSGAYAVFVASSDEGLNGGIEADATFSFALNNGGDTVSIVCGAGLIDEVTYDDGGFFPNAQNATISLDPDLIDADLNDIGDAWCLGVVPYFDGPPAHTGTPGAPNPTCNVVLDTTIDFCRLQFPTEINEDAGTSVIVYGRVYEEGITDQSPGTDANPRILAQFGYGPDATDPDGNPAWAWLDAEPNPDYDENGAFGEPNNDEYQINFTTPSEGVYDFAYRFSRDGGQSWLYCDQGAGSSDGYQVENAGAMTTTGVVGGPVSSDALLPGDLIINEIMYDPHGELDDTQAEWAEVYNNTGVEIDLNGCSFSTSSSSVDITAPLVVPADGYVLFAKSADTGVNGGIIPDVVAPLIFANGGSTVTITCPAGTIDTVTYDDGGTFPDARRFSISLDPDLIDADLNDDGAAWCLASSIYYNGIASVDEDHYGTPGAPNDPCGPIN